MSWFYSIVIGLITGVFGCFGAGLVATLCVRWYRISSFEGGAGYYVVFIALLGAVVGLVGGVIVTRFVPAGDAEFLRGLGYAAGGMTALLAIVCLFCRLAADLAPEIDGKSLELAIEVQCPAGFQIPEKLDEYGAFAGVVVINGRHQPTEKLRLDEAKTVDGRLVVPTTVPLGTRASRKFLRVYFNKEVDLMFSLPLRSNPNENDLAWSKWVESGWDVGKPEPAAEKKFKMRYRVQVIEPEPPGPTHEEMLAKEAAEEQARFEAIAPDAPITQWLPYTRYGAREDRLRVAVERITARANYVAELSELMIAEEQEVAVDAQRLVAHVPRPDAALVKAVEDAGRHLVERLRKGNEITPAQDESFLWAADISVRFSAWMEAVRTLREKSGGDFTPILGEILVLSRVREDSYVMRVDVRRVASYYMQQWAGLAPVAGDPPPR